jgi:hypothetical protein
MGHIQVIFLQILEYQNIRTICRKVTELTAIMLIITTSESRQNTELYNLLQKGPGWLTGSGLPIRIVQEYKTHGNSREERHS